MSLSGCYAVLKYIVVFVNLILWLAGLAILSVAIWLLADPTLYVRIIHDEAKFYIGLYIFLGVGLLMFVVGLLGCSGAYRESQCMLVSFFCFLLIILVAEIAGGAWAYTHSERLEEMIEDSVKVTVEHEYGIVRSRTVTFDVMQQGLKCCGATGINDWLNSRINKVENHRGNWITLTLRSPSVGYKIPESCCRDDLDTPCGFEGLPIAGFSNGHFYEEGCAPKLIQFLKTYSDIIFISAISIILVEILCLIFSIILCCAIRSVDRYKA